MIVHWILGTFTTISVNSKWRHLFLILHCKNFKTSNFYWSFGPDLGWEKFSLTFKFVVKFYKLKTGFVFVITNPNLIKLYNSNLQSNFNTSSLIFLHSDPAIKSLVPLRNVINEICKHQQFQQPPIVRTFDELYKNIESERFEKLHFTLDSTQFYQEKFQSDDCSSLAIVFGNRKVIEQTSGSKIMYVDTSFKIDSNETFTYQLVTVLVWVQDSVSIF